MLLQIMLVTELVTQNANRLKQIALLLLLVEIQKVRGDAPPKKVV
jgi:hypothetical protein